MGDFIEPHDDEGVTTIDGREYFRVLALVYYLTGPTVATEKDSPPWQSGEDSVDGGCFIDYGIGKRQPGKYIAPKHNSLVAFQVPRLHEVQKMKTDRPRFSVFGWLYAPLGGGAKKTASNNRAKRRKKQGKGKR